MARQKGSKMVSAEDAALLERLKSQGALSALLAKETVEPDEDVKPKPSAPVPTFDRSTGVLTVKIQLYRPCDHADGFVKTRNENVVLGGCGPFGVFPIDGFPVSRIPVGYEAVKWTMNVYATRRKGKQTYSDFIARGTHDARLEE